MSRGFEIETELTIHALELGVPLDEAKADMNKVWVPNTVWTNFARTVLTNNSVNPDCGGWDWTPSTIGD